MHELSLACNILEITEEAVKANNAKIVIELVLDIGVFAGVEINALETAINSIKPKTILEKSKISINIIEGKAVCRHCHCEFIPEDILSPCPECAKYGLEIIAGGELKVRTIIAE
jgi:hydrogenase nickel incorporation protein HypA/HybF